MINSQNYQGRVIINSTNEFSGAINNTYSNVNDYFLLKKANNQLLNENTILLNQLINNTLNDSSILSNDSLFEYIGAKVISNSTHKRNNYIRLNKGSKHGVKIDMGVVSAKGIIGIIIGVSENYCSVMSMLHKNSKLSAKIKKNEQLVNVVWDKIDYRIGKLKDIPTHLNLFKGDTIITSGNSLIFPKGITIGFIEEYINEAGESLNSASLLFASDFNALHYVYIIKNNYKNELLKLINTTKNE